MSRLFGTDGVRGVAGRDITCELAFSLGQAGAHVLTRGAHKPTILVGRDTRLSGGMLESALIAGMLSVGAHVTRLGVITTPAVAYLTRRFEADAGAMISASHNPFEDNGIKFFSGSGYKLPDAAEDAIEALIHDGAPLRRAEGDAIGVAGDEPRAKDIYIDYLLGTLNARLDGVVALDCANGSASSIAPELFRRAGADVTALSANPDGLNINDGCGSTHPEFLRRHMLGAPFIAGFAFDGDADRVMAVDETGGVLDGDAIMAVLAQDMRKKGKLAGNAVVATVMSNLGLEMALRESGIALERTAVGDRYVLERMMEKGYVLGGEQSGHVIMKEHATTGDGLLTALHLMAVLNGSGTSLSKLHAHIRHLPQVLLNVRIDPKHKDNWDGVPAITEAIRGAEAGMADRGRVLVRASGTEPLLRVMLEGEDRALVESHTQAIADAIRRSVGNEE